MTHEEKIIAYQKLVDKRKNYTFIDKSLKNPSQSKFDTREIEPWAQWQNNLNAKILLIGQEFSDYQTFINTEGKVELVPNKYAYPSNKNLYNLFNLLGYDLGHPLSPNKENPIFFTNAVMGLKTPPMSANFKTSWIKESRDLFLKPLIDIIQPKIIITMGAVATKSVVELYNLKTMSLKNMVDNSPITVSGDRLIFPVFHTGGLGLRNRNNELQLKDWNKIKEWL